MADDNENGADEPEIVHGDSGDIVVSGDRISQVDLQLEMQRSYLDYAMSVIVGRALPEVRDGLKPVHRRVLYAMYDGGYRPDRAFSKCSRVVGDVMGHGMRAAATMVPPGPAATSHTGVAVVTSGTGAITQLPWGSVWTVQPMTAAICWAAVIGSVPVFSAVIV